MFKSLLIEYASPVDLSDSVVLEYRLRDHSMVPRWVDTVIEAKNQYSIDEPKRFYGFGSHQEQVDFALAKINAVIDTINQYQPIVKKHLTDIQDQDTLNYLHHIFEVYHGLLDQQIENTFWHLAPVEVRKALSDLNIAVHRCESMFRAAGPTPRHVVTWFGLPKTRVLEESDYQFFEQTWKPGTVFINYVEIGKTVEELAVDNDQYIAPGAFQPFRRYSADFVVRFFEQTQSQADAKRAIMLAYYEKHKHTLGPWQPCFVNGNIPVADLVGSLDLSQLQNRQYVKSVSFS